MRIKGRTAPMFIAALFTTAKTKKQHKCPLTDEWIKKMLYVYVIEYYSAIKKTKKCHFQDGSRDSQLSEVSQKEKDKYYMISPICGI